MRQEKRAYLEKKYESKLNPKEDPMTMGKPAGGGPKMPGPGKRNARY